MVNNTDKTRRGFACGFFCLKLYNLQMPESVGAWKGIVHSFLRETTSKCLKEILKLLKLKYQENRHPVLYCYPIRVGFENNTLNNQLQTEKFMGKILLPVSRSVFCVQTCRT